MNETLRDASLNILRQLLDEETLVLSQLTYVVEYLHDPLLEGCKPVSAKQREEESRKDGETQKPPAFLTFAQHWELFANIATLHGAQGRIVSMLEAAVIQRTRLLKRHAAAKEAINTSDTQVESLEDGNTLADMAGLESTTELFASAAMRHYMAEHMMYSLNYSRNIAPRVIELSRLWRCRQDKHASGTSLTAEERQQLACYSRFLRFLWCVMGREAGVPEDPRLVFTRLPDMSSPVSSLRGCRGGGGAVADGNAIPSASSAVVASAMMRVDPPISPNWRGFETLLVLLATPLASLRRYMHVSRCLIESECLDHSVCRHLQSEFVDVVALRVVEEGSVVLDELAKQDISHVMVQIDEVAVTASTGSCEKKFPHIRPDANGNRTLVHYGRLAKRFRRGRHDRLVFLFSDWLCYVEELANGRMRLRASIALDGLKVVGLENTADMANRFDILTKEIRLTFFAPTREQKRQWVSALRNTVMAYEKRVQRLSSLQPQQYSGGVVRLMRATALPLSHNSRLRRLQRADRVLQEELEKHTLVAPSATKAPLSQGAASITTSPPALSSVAMERRPPILINFDVTHWAHQSTETPHRRVRSSDFIAQMWTAPSPLEVSNTAPVGADDADVDGRAEVTSLPKSPCMMSRTPMRRVLLDHFQDSNTTLPVEKSSSRKAEKGMTAMLPPTPSSSGARRRGEWSFSPERNVVTGVDDSSGNEGRPDGKRGDRSKPPLIPVAEVAVRYDHDILNDDDDDDDDDGDSSGSNSSYSSPLADPDSGQCTGVS